MNVGEILLSYFLDTINFHREETETIAWFNKKNIHNESKLIGLILKQQSFSLGETEMERDCKH